MIAQTWRSVRVVSVEGRMAVVVDQSGAHIDVRADVRRGGGPFPRVGETWIIDRSMGFWTFGSLVVAKPPRIEGVQGPGVLKDLLGVLDAAGLIEDATTLPPGP